jgi:hypothetical protein
MSHEFLRYFLVFLGIVVFIRWSGGGRRLRRHRHLYPPGRGRSPEALAAIETRLLTAERLEARVDELENRLDFAERLMARRPVSEHPSRD